MKNRNIGHRNPKPLGGALLQALKKYGLDAGIRSARVLLDWEKTAGEKIARHARAVDLKNGVLTVEVDSPAWIQQLSLIKKEVIKKVNADGRIVRDIKFRPGNTRKKSVENT